MATDPSTTTAPDGGTPPAAFTQEDVNRLIAAEKRRFQEKYADYDALKAAAEQAAKEAESSQSETQKLAARVAAAEKAAADTSAQLKAAQLAALRVEVGAAKGLTPAQARRLVGETQEELEADADELLTAFAPSDDGAADGDGTPPTPSRKPVTSLRAGLDPEEPADETDPLKLAGLIPR